MEQFEERKSEIPILPSNDETACISQIEKLVSLFSFFDTSNDTLALLDKTITSLKKLKYRAIQQVLLFAFHLA